MANVSYGVNFNPINTFIPGVYLQVIPPQAVFGGVPTTIGATSGTASWWLPGEVGFVSSNSGIASFCGPMGPPALTDPFDIATSATVALAQGQGINGLALYLSPIGDGTQSKATVALKDTTAATYANITAKKFGVLGGAITPVLSAGAAGPDQTFTLTGSTTTNDVVNILFVNGLLPGGQVNIQYTVQSGDTTLTLLAASLAAAITANTILGTVGFTATSNAAVLTVSWGTNLASVTITTSVNGTTTATVGGTLTIGDVLSITVADSRLPAGTKTVSYTTIALDTTTLMATGLKNAINADTDLAAIGVTALSSAAVVSITSTSKTQTTYTKLVTGTAPTETITLAAGPTEVITTARVPSINVVIQPFNGGGSPESFPGLPGTPGRFPAALQTAMNSGLNAGRGPSNFITVSSISSITNPIALGSFTLSGGADGRATVSTGQLVGSATSSPPTGLFAVKKLQFTPSVAWVTGLTDPAGWATVQNYATTYNVFCLCTFASGGNVPSYVAQKNTAGIANYQIGFVAPFLQFLDTANGLTRFIDPQPFAAGTIASLSPWISPLNKSVQLVTGSEIGSATYSDADLTSAGQAGIMLITNPIGQGPIWGFQNGYNSVGNNDPTAYVEYSRMTNFLVQTNAATLGKYLGDNTTFNNTDSSRALIQGSLTKFLAALQSIPAIGDFSVECDTGNNPQSQLALHEVQINENVQFLPSIQTIFGQVQGGTTVQIAQSNNATNISFNG